VTEQIIYQDQNKSCR